VLELERDGLPDDAKCTSSDGRSVVVRFTRRGVKLMRETFDHDRRPRKAEIAMALGPRRYRPLCASLAALAAERPIGT